MGKNFSVAKKNPNGRPIKLTLELITKISESIRVGNYIETACAKNGINKDTLHAWLRLGCDAPTQSLYYRFSDAVTKAQAESEARDIDIIDKAALSGIWQAAAWRLERKFNSRWGRPNKLQVEISKAEDTTRTVELTDEELTQRYLELHRANLLVGQNT